RAAAQAGAANDVDPPGAGDVAGGHAHAAGEVRVVGEEAAEGRAAAAAVDGNARPAAGVRPTHYVGEAVAIHVPGGDGHAAREGLVEGHKVLQVGAVLAADDHDVGPAPGAGGADDVRRAVAVDVADGHADAT